MIEKTMYIADDGATFENEEDCREYEAQTKYSDMLQAITLFSENGTVIHFNNDLPTFNEMLDDAHFIFIPSYLTNSRVAAFSEEVMSEYYGKYFPTATGLYRWNWDEEGWTSFEADVAKVTKQWKAMLNITITSERR